MTQVSSEKKICQNEYFADNNKVSLWRFMQKYDKLFIVYRRNNIDVAYSFLLGLMKCEKNHTNMERMVEQVPEQAYHQYHNFLSESKWEYQEGNNRTALEASTLLESCKTNSGKQTGLLKKEKQGASPIKVKADVIGWRGNITNH